MTQGPPKKLPPPPPSQALKSPPPPRMGAGRAQSPEGIIVNSGGVSERLAERLRALLPAAIRNTLFIDGRNTVIADGRPIGIMEGGRLLIDHSPMFSHIPVPPAMRNIAQAGRMKIFIEVGEKESQICAGDSLGQKKLYSRIG